MTNDVAGGFTREQLGSPHTVMGGEGRPGLQVTRRFTAAGRDPLDDVPYERRSSTISNPDGSVVFKMDGAEIPASWSQLASDILISKYFRKAGLHGDKDQGETSVRQVVRRLAHTIRTEGEKFGGYFATSLDADAFEAELSFMLVHQHGAFNSPVWFNLGLWHEYEIVGQGGNWAWDEEKEVSTGNGIYQTTQAYENPQCSACFIQDAKDDLMSIYDLLKSEARLFKYGSGTGSNFSAIRGRQEKLSGGGTSSGLLSFLEVFDRAAGSTKSGGTCLAPYQRVYTASGPVPVAELAERESFVTLSYDPPAGRYKAKKARAWLAGEKNVVRVVTDKGAFEITDDHPVKMSTGEFMHAGKLVEGLSLFACSIDMGHDHIRVHLRDGRKGKEFLHRLVASDVMGLDIEGLSVHHKDENTRNNEPWNLEAKTQADHARDHNLDRVAEGTHLFQLQTFPNPGDANGMHADSPFWKDAQKVESYRAKQAEILAESGRAPIMQEYAAEQKMLNTAFEILNAGHSIDTFESYVDGRKAVVGRIGSITKLRGQIIDRFGSYGAFVKAVAANNHRVVRVEAVGTMPVYDVEVECPTADDKSPSTGHNFVIWPSDDHIGSGVVVANTRRAAKMVCLDMDHPEIVDFINWKKREEKKAHALIAMGYASDFNGEAYHTISGQNSNNSVRVSDQFMTAAKGGGSWSTRARTTGEVVETFEAKDLWRQIAEAAWSCADPGVQYDTTINRWHTCPNTDRINASNPCSEYMFLDDTACNLASINLTKYLRDDGSFDIEGYRHACRIFFMAQEILVDLSSYPTENIARNSHRFRPLGLGFANLGSLLMSWGVPYDSEKGRAIAAGLTAIMCGHAYKTSAEMAATKGPFDGFAANREPMLTVMNMHLVAADNIGTLHGGQELRDAAVRDWTDAVDLGTKHGYRNAQATVLAPTGTIGLLMDCDTTGVEPDFALVKFKKLAGGGHFKIVNQTVPVALRRLRYSETQVLDIVAYISGTNSLSAGVHINRRTLKEKGLTDVEIGKVETALPGVFDIDSAFAAWIVGEEAYTRLGAPVDKKKSTLLEHLGFTRAQIDEAGAVIVGRMTIEGAPHLRAEHYAIFDCANRCGKTGKRFLAPMSHVHMMAAVQPFLSGAISKTVNLPSESTVEEVQHIYEEGWRLGLKAVALYRDGCKASQPLSTGGDKKDDKNAASTERLAPMPATSGTQPPQLSLAIAPAGTRIYGERARLPHRRRGFTQEAKIGSHKIYIRTGEYENGQLGEIFIDMHKEGAAFRSVMNCLAMSVSLGLQYGVPLAKYVDQFTFTRFEPSGVVTGHPHVKVATSLVDYIFRTLAIEYLGRHDLAHVKPEIAEEGQTGMGVPRDQDPSRMPLQLPAADGAREARPESSMDAQLDGMMGDAPLCNVCGHITVRNGSCYRCLNCGNSMGCS